jgi:hypothetical protein
VAVGGLTIAKGDGQEGEGEPSTAPGDEDEAANRCIMGVERKGIEGRCGD